MNESKRNTKPVLAKCMHLDLGWCVDCIEKFCDDFQERVEEAINPGAFEHEAVECKAIGELLSYMIEWDNKEEHNNLLLKGKLGIHSEWGHKLGTISNDDEDMTFRYYPSIYFSNTGESCSDSND